MSFFRTMQDDINELFFTELSRVEQDRVLQALYDKKYSVPSIAKKLSVNTGSVYSRINAHRGRGPEFSA